MPREPAQQMTHMTSQVTQTPPLRQTKVACQQQVLRHPMDLNTTGMLGIAPIAVSWPGTAAHPGQHAAGPSSCRPRSAATAATLRQPALTDRH
jgi:hypothetical protein